MRRTRRIDFCEYCTYQRGKHVKEKKGIRDLIPNLEEFLQNQEIDHASQLEIAEKKKWKLDKERKIVQEKEAEVVHRLSKLNLITKEKK
jgi:hypothetical protein